MWDDKDDELEFEHDIFEGMPEVETSQTVDGEQDDGPFDPIREGEALGDDLAEPKHKGEADA